MDCSKCCEAVDGEPGNSACCMCYYEEEEKERQEDLEYLKRNNG